MLNISLSSRRVFTSRATASRLAIWVCRAEHFFLLWYEDGQGDFFVYTDAMIEPYVPTMSWIEWATRQEIDSDVLGLHLRS